MSLLQSKITLLQLDTKLYGFLLTPMLNFIYHLPYKLSKFKLAGVLMAD